MKILYNFAILSTFFLHVNTSKEGDKAESRIVGGHPATLREVYYMAAVQTQFVQGGSRSFCGGTLISMDRVLTAAHCFFDGFGKIISKDMVKVFAEVTDLALTETNGTSVGQYREVRHVVPHGDYSHLGGRDNNIALVFVTEPFKTTPVLRPISWRSGKTYAGEACFASGFGSTYASGEPTGILSIVDVPTVSSDRCVDIYGKKQVTKNMVCAGSVNKDVCKGDLGGPLVCAGMFAGIASHGERCGHPDFPRVYIEVAKYTDWILRNNSDVMKSAYGVIVTCFVLLFINFKIKST